jgi:hypothetical protein
MKFIYGQINLEKNCEGSRRTIKTKLGRNLELFLF